jgi:hypothetical protein
VTGLSVQQPVHVLADSAACDVLLSLTAAELADVYVTCQYPNRNVVAIPVSSSFAAAGALQQ